MSERDAPKALVDIHVWILVGFKPNEPHNLYMVTSSDSKIDARLETDDVNVAVEILSSTTKNELNGWKLHAVRLPTNDRLSESYRRDFIRFLADNGVPPVDRGVLFRSFALKITALLREGIDKTSGITPISQSKWGESQK